MSPDALKCPLREIADLESKRVKGCVTSRAFVEKPELMVAPGVSPPSRRGPQLRPRGVTAGA